MKHKTWKTYVVWVVLAEAVGALSGYLSREGMKLYGDAVIQPPLSPPMWLFPVAWTVLYALMGIGVARVRLAQPSAERNSGVNLFVIQLVVNFFWSIIFFNAQAYGFALVWLMLLCVLVLWMILEFRKVERLAGWLQIPYLLWLTFAAWLNYGVWKLNG